MRVCTIFNNACPWTTGIHINRAFEKIGVDTLFASPTETKPDADLYVYVDSANIDPIDTPKEKTIYYAIDSYQLEPSMFVKLGGSKGDMTTGRKGWWITIPDQVKLLFNAFEQGRTFFKSIGADSMTIEMGINEDIYFPVDMPTKYNVCFIGSVGSPTTPHLNSRNRLLDKIASKHTVYVPKVCNEELSNAAHISKVFLDIPPLDGDMLGQRFFEGYGLGRVMVSPKRPALDRYLGPGIFEYTNEEDILPTIDAALAYQKDHPIVVRDVEHMKWTTKVSIMVEEFLK